ncbi:hypothetical protein DET54_1169 [Paenibacillus pabuli]|uniref:Self-protective colicin-like immunity protein n=1 Tax=Paenibacillus pabuli TaxID=1472 RepID=A0ABX9BDS8_9BACL|nr:hypothetical protein [Paenibacillus pabuli]RAI88121.1 hypothetical protein DET54_1169 [Paenibacillus pabuli]
MGNNLYFPARTIVRKMLEVVWDFHASNEANSGEFNTIVCKHLCQMIGIEFDSSEGEYLQEVFGEYAVGIRTDLDESVNDIFNKISFVNAIRD